MRAEDRLFAHDQPLGTLARAAIATIRKRPSMSKLSNPRTIAFLSAFAVVALIFSVTLVWRLNLASEITTSRSEIVTAQLYAWLQNWVHEGPFSIHFMMPYLPLSIENPGLQYRDELYGSYPPGALVSVYVLSELLRALPITVLT